MTHNLLSIIIVNWNTRRLLDECLDSIFTTCQDLPLEVIVVDNGSGDGSQEMVREKYPQVKQISNTENLGFARANNQGLQMSAGSYCLLLNSDTRVLPHALQRIVQFFDSRPEAGALGPRLLNPDSSLQPSGHSFPTLKSAFGDLLPIPAGVRRKLRGPLEFRDFNQLAQVDEVSGAALALRSSALKQTGLLDERFFFLGEDVDLCWRLKKAGWKIYFLPQAEVVHYWGGSRPSQDFGRHSLLAQRALYLLFRKHRSRLEAGILKIFLSGLTLVKMIKWAFHALRPGKSGQLVHAVGLHLSELRWLWSSE